MKVNEKHNKVAAILLTLGYTPESEAGAHKNQATVNGRWFGFYGGGRWNESAINGGADQPFQVGAERGTLEDTAENVAAIVAYLKGGTLPAGLGKQFDNYKEVSEYKGARDALKDVFAAPKASTQVETLVVVPAAALIAPTLSAADAIAALRAKKAAAAAAADPRIARTLELMRAGATQDEVAEILAAELG